MLLSLMFKSRALNYVIFSLLIITSEFSFALRLDDSYTGVWQGIEIMGCDLEIANQIRKTIPLDIGSEFKLSNKEKYRDICNKHVKKYLPNENVECGFIFFTDGVAYMNIQVLPREYNNQFRAIPIPDHPVPKIPDEVNKVYMKIQDRMDEMAKRTGTFPTEIYDGGFIDFTDPILHELAQELTRIAFDYNEVILEVVRYEPDPMTRADAANLLSWTRHPENFKYIVKWDLLSDSYLGVRNNLARSFVFLIQKVESKEILNDLLQLYCKMVSLPEHTDRNKALYSIQEVLEKDPSLVNAMDQACIGHIHYIAEASILSNVGGVAKEILEFMELNKLEKNTHHHS
mgnify:CR=1 FL=1